MSTKVFAIRDIKAGYFAMPFLARNEFVAKRMLTATASDPATDIFQFPNDYELFYIADFDEDTGVYTSVDKESLGFASAYKQLGLYPPVQLADTISDNSTEG